MRSAGVEVETVFLETKVRYGEISYNAKDVLQRKGGWRPSERQVSIVMEDPPEALCCPHGEVLPYW